MYVCMYVLCMYVCMYVRVYVCAIHCKHRQNSSVCMYIYVCMYICIHTCQEDLTVYVCMYVCMYVWRGVGYNAFSMEKGAAMFEGRLITPVFVVLGDTERKTFFDYWVQIRSGSHIIVCMYCMYVLYVCIWSCILMMCRLHPFVYFHL